MSDLLTNAKYIQRNREKLLIKFALLIATLEETLSLTESLDTGLVVHQ